MFFYEDDGGNDKGVNVKLSTKFKLGVVEAAADVSFSIDNRDENLGWIEIYHWDEKGREYALSSKKGFAKVLISQ